MLSTVDESNPMIDSKTKKIKQKPAEEEDVE
jgi:hypothetical protein